MDRETLRAAQTILRERYAEDPAAARTPLRATAGFREPGVTCTSTRLPVQFEQACRGQPAGEDACSAGLLLEALLSRAGVTLRSVATTMGLDLGEVRLTADSEYDARGTLGIDRSVDVGVAPITITVEVPIPLDDRTIARLAKSTERYCVVGQSLRHPPVVVIRSGP